MGKKESAVDVAMVVFDTVEDAIGSAAPWESVILANSVGYRWRIQVWVAGVRFWGLVKDDPTKTCHWLESDNHTLNEQENLLDIAGVAGLFAPRER
jgi:hypothetical protein